MVQKVRKYPTLKEPENMLQGLLEPPPTQMNRGFFLWCCGPTRAMASSFLRFLDHTQRRITVGRTPLD